MTAILKVFYCKTCKAATNGQPFCSHDCALTQPYESEEWREHDDAQRLRDHKSDNKRPY